MLTVTTITPGSADHFDDLFNNYNKWKSLETAFGAWKTLRGSVGGSWSDGSAASGEDVHSFQLKVKAMGAWKRDTYAEDLHGVHYENKFTKKVFDAWRGARQVWQWQNLPAGDPTRNPEELQRIRRSLKAAQLLATPSAAAVAAEQDDDEQPPATLEVKATLMSGQEFTMTLPQDATVDDALRHLAGELEAPWEDLNLVEAPLCCGAAFGSAGLPPTISAA